jgi:glutathione peroxidase
MTWVLSLLLSSSFAAPPAPAPEVSVPSALASLSLVRLDGSPLPAAELAGKVVLFVNVASKCGYTPQYDGLEKLYAAHKARGLVIVGVPCNQFGGQEPGAPEEIATFCKLNYGVTFPLLEKQDVNAGGRSPLYQWLVGSPAGRGEDISWNFEKFLVDRAGEVVARFAPDVKPDAPELVAAAERALG